MSVSVALTVGEIARRVRAPIHRVTYIARTRDIRPLARAGNARVFSEADVEFIASELRQIDSEQVETFPGVA